MVDLALTGGIGSGKSTVAKMLAVHGAIIIDADAISRSLMEPGRPVLAQTVEAFGTDILDDHGRLDRPKLAAKVFGDEQALARLNGIVHPAVRAESARQRQEALDADPDGAIIIQDIPLLVETGQTDKFEGVIVVHTPQDIRLERLVESRGMSTDDAQSRMNNQATDEQRKEVADWIIDNSGDLEHTQNQVEELWATLTQTYRK